jgi:16S rRNA C967 or C1407 C5-methylase (RsmB/RsmF family)
MNIKFDKILCDVPCSGEGTLRSSPKTHLIWNINMIKKLSRLQKALASSAFSLLKEDGEMIYSTCTHSPEENESVVNYLISLGAKVEKIELPIKTRPGIKIWQGQVFDEQVKNCARVWPQDNDTEGFFIAKVRK